MLDWMTIWASLEGWVQWVITLALMCLIGIAGIAFILRQKKIAIDCAILAVVLFLVAVIVEQMVGLQLLLPEVFGFFSNLFN